MKDIFVTQPAMPPLDDYIELLKEIWANKHLTNNGKIHVRLENELKQYLKSPGLTLFTNGHMALDIAIKALDLKGEIITTPFTFVSTTHAISMCGCTPIFCDIKPTDYTIDESKREALITNQTSAILAVHVYGNPCNVYKIQEIADKYNLKVIYDAAHAFGVELNGLPISSFGDISMFSFHATKVYHTIEGGALVYNDLELEKRLNRLKNFGLEDGDRIIEVGYNAKMNEFSAAMGLCNLRAVDDYIQQRKMISDEYYRLLTGLNGIQLQPKISDNLRCNYAYFPILIDNISAGINRDQLYQYLNTKGIFTRKYFYPMITTSDCYKVTYGDIHLPVAQDICNKVLALPIYPDLMIEDVERICSEIIAFISQISF